MKFAVLFAAAGVAVLMTACGPKLAETPLSEEETQWQTYLQKNYPGWRPPQTVYPGGIQAAPQDEVVYKDPKVVSEDWVAGSDGNDFEIISDTKYSDGTTVHRETWVETAKYTEYTVKKGDTLGAISKKYYNKASSWRKIYSANTNVISDPNKLKVGTVLRIPQQ